MEEIYDLIETATDRCEDVANVIAELFKGADGKTPIEIMKWKEIYQGLEDACDECKDFTHVLGNVVIKNA